MKIKIHIYFCVVFGVFVWLASTKKKKNTCEGQMLMNSIFTGFGKKLFLSAQHYIGFIHLTHYTFTMIWVKYKCPGSPDMGSGWSLLQLLCDYLTLVSY